MVSQAVTQARAKDRFALIFVTSLALPVGRDLRAHPLLQLVTVTSYLATPQCVLYSLSTFLSWHLFSQVIFLPQTKILPARESTFLGLSPWV